MVFRRGPRVPGLVSAGHAGALERAVARPTWRSVLRSVEVDRLRRLVAEQAFGAQFAAEAARFDAG